MRDEEKHIELQRLLDVQPQLSTIFRQDETFASSVYRAFSAARNAGRSMADLSKFFGLAAQLYESNRKAALDNVEAFFMSFAPPTPLTDFIQKELAKAEAVKYLKPGSFESFLEISDSTLSGLLLNHTASVMENRTPNFELGREELVSEYLGKVEFLVSQGVQGRMILDDRDGEVYMYNPIGEILDQGMIDRLDSFLEAKRPLTKVAIRKMLALFDVKGGGGDDTVPPANYVWPSFFEDFLGQNDDQLRWIIRVVIFRSADAINDIVFKQPRTDSDEPIFKVILEGLYNCAVGRYLTNKKTGELTVWTPVGASPDAAMRERIQKKIGSLRGAASDELWKILNKQKDQKKQALETDCSVSSPAPSGEQLRLAL